jgi:hypothetical protein
MDVLDNLFQLKQNELLAILPVFQAKLIMEMSVSENDYLIIADRLLSAKTENTVGFGGQPGIGNKNVFRDNIMIELEKFICGDEKYNEERKKLGVAGTDASKVMLGVIAHAIGASLGTAGAFILPVVALLILSASSIGRNAWCETRKQIRAEADNVP